MVRCGFMEVTQTAMSKSFYIHIGIPKTGSTALQLFFDENREALREAFALYPKAAIRAGGHHDIAFLLHGGYPKWAIPQGKPLDVLWSELEKESKGHEGDIILSSENFYLFPEPAHLAKLLASSKVFQDQRPRIIVYLRPQEELIEAWYNQTVKAQGSTATFRECLEQDRSHWDYDARLQPWADAFGQENIKVRIYRGGSGKQWDIRTDFLDCFGIDPQGFFFSQEKPNANLNCDLLEFQRIMNRLPLTPPEKRRFHKELMELSNRTRNLGIFNENPLLSQEDRSKVRYMYENSNGRVARTYQGKSELFPALKVADYPHAPYTGLGEEALTSILGWILLKSR
jgi:hypothetical protein